MIAYASDWGSNYKCRARATKWNRTIPDFNPEWTRVA